LTALLELSLSLLIALHITYTNICYKLPPFIIINCDNAHLPEIKEDRMEDFLDMIEKNAVGSRAEQEDIVRDDAIILSVVAKFIFYEVYEGML